MKKKGKQLSGADDGCSTTGSIAPRQKILSSADLAGMAFRDPEEYRTLWVGTVKVRQEARSNEGFQLAESILKLTGQNADKYYCLLSVEALSLYTLTGVDAKTSGKDSFSQSGEQLLCATISFVQITEIELNQNAVVVHYTSNVVRRLRKRDVLRRLVPPVRLVSGTKRDTAAKGDNEITLQLSDQAEATNLARVMERAVRNFVMSVSLLDKGLPSGPEDSQLCSVSFLREDTPRFELVLDHGRKWGQEINIPTTWIKAEGVDSPFVSYRRVRLRCELYTPMGAASANITPLDMDTAMKDSSGLFHVTASVHSIGEQADEDDTNRMRRRMLEEALQRLKVVLHCRIHKGHMCAPTERLQSLFTCSPDSSNEAPAHYGDGDDDGQQGVAAKAVVEPVSPMAFGAAVLSGMMLMMMMNGPCSAVMRVVFLALSLVCGWWAVSHVAWGVKPRGTLQVPASVKALVRKVSSMRARQVECVVLQLLQCEIMERIDLELMGEPDSVEMPPPRGLQSCRSIVLTGIDDLPGLCLKDQFMELQQGNPYCTRDMVQRYLDGCKGNERRALERLKLTLDWRKQEGIDNILNEPQPKYDIIKKNYMHGVHCRAKDGAPVWIEHMGTFTQSFGNSIKDGVTEDEMLRHWLFVNEYMFIKTCPEPLPRGKCIKILDVKGLGMQDLRGPAFAYGQRSGLVLQSHYLERLQSAYVVNVPAWWALVWRLVSTLVDANTRERIHIMSSKKELYAALLEVMHEEDIPVEYGGTCKRTVYESADERELAEFVKTHCNAAKADMERK